MAPRVEASFVNSWIALCKTDRDTQEHRDHSWAFDYWFDRRDDVDLVWSFILSVLAKDRSRQVMEQLSAGPLENLIADHGEEVVERVEAEARRNPAFASLLGGVWQSDAPPHIWKRVQAVWDWRGWDGIPAA